MNWSGKINLLPINFEMTSQTMLLVNTKYPYKIVDLYSIHPSFVTLNCNLRSSLLRCGTRPNEWGTQWDSNSLLQVCKPLYYPRCPFSHIELVNVYNHRIHQALVKLIHIELINLEINVLMMYWMRKQCNNKSWKLFNLNCSVFIVVESLI